MNKYEKYHEIQRTLIAEGVQVGEYIEIAYGLQFSISKKDLKGIVRVYESKKKGLTVDLSQIKAEELKELFSLNPKREKSLNSVQQPMNKEKVSGTFKSDELDIPLIGIDESGKGDYFGPLVVAGVHASKEQKLYLISLGVTDSKKLSDKQIKDLALKIKGNCVYEILTIKNDKYNALYDQIKNLNHLLAWGHARVLENLLEKQTCEYALSDQFGKESLIQSALMSKGKGIILEQRPRAEQNVVVAAASILARDEFVTQIETLSTKYEMTFPKGAGEKTLKIAQQFVQRYDRISLKDVCKLHFKTTESV